MWTWHKVIMPLVTFVEPNIRKKKLEIGKTFLQPLEGHREVQIICNMHEIPSESRY